MSNALNNSDQKPNTIIAQRIAAALQVAKSGSGANAHELLNNYNLQEAKKKTVKAHFDKFGRTIPTTAIVLATDAARNIRHSRTLARNINKANRGQVRPDGVDAHHIVGRVHGDAAIARSYLFMWGIAINDADNGVYLPRYASSRVPSLPFAPNHQGLHTSDYYFNVTMRLQPVSNSSTAAGRTVLRTIAAELVAGVFPF